MTKVVLASETSSQCVAGDEIAVCHDTNGAAGTNA